MAILLGQTSFAASLTSTILLAKAVLETLTASQRTLNLSVSAACNVKVDNIDILHI